jgi:hypothetical protein
LKLGWGVVVDGVLHRDGLFRELDGHDEDLFADRSTPFVTRTKHIFSNCLQRLGTLEDRKDLVKAVSQFTTVDRFQVMIHLRRMSLGDMYRMEVECEKCGCTAQKMFDLSQIRTEYPETPEQRVYEGIAPSGTIIKWEVMTGDKEEISAKIREYEQTSSDKKASRANKDIEKARISLAMWLRVISVGDRVFKRTFPVNHDGVPIVDMEEIAVLQGMSMKDRLWLRHKMEKTEAGPDLKFEFRCEKDGCKHLQETTVDITQSEFFFPLDV